MGSRTTQTLRSTTAAAAQRAEHRRGIVGPGRGGDHQPGDVAEHGRGIVVVEVATEALLVAVAGHPDQHGIVVLPIAEKNGRLAASPRSWSSALCR